MGLTIDYTCRLKEIREKAGMRQKDLAERTGLNQQTISAYEKGRIKPPLVICARLAAILGCSMWDIADVKVKGA